MAATGMDLAALANRLLDATDPDLIEVKAKETAGPLVEDSHRQAAEEALKDAACAPFDDPVTRHLLIAIKQKSEMLIDEINTDRVISAGYDLNQAQDKITNFKTFINDNKDELTALQILYNQPYGQQRLTAAIVEQRFNLWIGREKQQGREYTEDQMAWLTLIRDYIAANAEITRGDLQAAPGFFERGGVAKAHALFGERLTGLLDDLVTALVA